MTITRHNLTSSPTTALRSNSLGLGVPVSHRCALFLIASAAALAGCASSHKLPPTIALDEPAAASADAVPVPLAMDAAPALPSMAAGVPPARMIAVPRAADKEASEPVDETLRVARANKEARVAPTREGYVNAIQVWPYSEGSLYQVYTSPGRVTAIALQDGEELVTVSAGDTVRWIVGDTTGGSGNALRVNILVKPTRVGLTTNLVITTNRRTYLLELTSTAQSWMASVSWEYANDPLVSLHKQAAEARGAAPWVSGAPLEQLRFRYAISGDSPSWKPLRAFDDGQKVYIQFPSGIAQGELPPLFVIGAQGDAQLVNYRYRPPYYVVDRLFGAAELRLGKGKSDVVRIERVDAQGGTGSRSGS